MSIPALPFAVSRPDQIPMEWFRRVNDILQSLANPISPIGGGGLRTSFDQGGLSIVPEGKEWFIASLGSESSGAYAWTRLVSTTSGTNSTDGYGTAGTTTLLPAYEINGRTGLASGTKVLMWPADSNAEMRFIVSDAASTAGTELKGLTFTSDTSSTADSDPGNGKFKWNNATQSSATVLYFDNQTVDSIVTSTTWASLANVGFISIQQSDDSTKWQLWKWVGWPVDGTGYYKFTVELQSYGGAITTAKTCYCTFSQAEHRFSGARLTGEAGTYGASGTPEAIDFTGASFDSGSYFAGGNPSRLTVPRAGIYQVGCSLGLNDAGDASGVTAAILYNGSSELIHSVVGPTTMGDGRNHVCLVTIYSCSAGDYFEVTVVTADAGGVSVDGDPNVSALIEPVFWITRLGDLT